jgi:hypothetical protein
MKLYLIDHFLKSDELTLNYDISPWLDAVFSSNSFFSLMKRFVITDLASCFQPTQMAYESFFIVLAILHNPTFLIVYHDPFVC